MAKHETSGRARRTEPNPNTDSQERKFRISRNVTKVFYFLVLVLMLVAGVFIGSQISTGHSRPSEGTDADGAVQVKPGPWGDLEYYPITIAAPEELLKVEGIEETPVKWFFKGYSQNDLARFFDNLDLSAGQRDQLLDPSSLSISPNGVAVTPPREVVFDLKPSAFEAIYRVLAGFGENAGGRWEILSKDIDSYRESGVSEKTIATLKKVSFSYGKYFVCYCMPYVLSTIPAYEEKAVVIKALTRQHTMLVKLRITPNTDINALTAYWGKAYWTTDVKAMVESVKSLPLGGQLDILELLPPLPTALLYTYPLPQNPLSGAPVIKNCSWAAFNFFRDPPDPRFSDANYVVEKLKTEYYPIQSDPHFGDVMIFLTPNDELIHTAVYIADGLVYTKNGDNPWHPWMFSNLSDLIDFFSIGLSPGQHITVQYYRNKYY